MVVKEVVIGYRLYQESLYSETLTILSVLMKCSYKLKIQGLQKILGLQPIVAIQEPGATEHTRYTKIKCLNTEMKKG